MVKTKKNQIGDMDSLMFYVEGEALEEVIIYMQNGKIFISNADIVYLRLHSIRAHEKSIRELQKQTFRGFYPRARMVLEDG